MSKISSFLLFLCYLFGIANHCFSQNPIPIYEVNNQGKLNISKHIEIYASDKKVNFSALINLPFNQWQQNRNPNTINLKISDSIYWFRFSLVNKTNANKYYLKITNKGINHLELFSVNKNSIKNYGKTGDYYSFGQRPYHSNHFIYPIEINTGDTSIFYLFCDKKNENLNTALYLFTDNEIKNAENKTAISMRMILGILVLAFIINLFLVYIFKDKLTLWYSIYIIAVINMILSFEGFDFEFIYPRYPFYASVSRFISGLSTLALMIHVMQLYVKQKKDNSKYFYAAIVSKWLNVLMIPITLIIYQWFPFLVTKKIHFYIFITVQITGILIILISTLEKIFQRYKPANFYFVATVMLLFTGIMSSVVETGVINHNVQSVNPMQWCFVAEVIIISIGILYRYQLLRKENQQLFDQLSLEKINNLKEIVDTQKFEQKRIAEDLHDLLGGQLAALKLKIASLSGDQKNKAENLIDDISENTRNIVHKMNLVEFNDNMLATIFNNYLTQLNKDQSTVFQFSQIGDAYNFNKETELNIYLVLMEIIHNILKHAQASEATVQFFFNEDNFEIIVEDNGIGILEKSNPGMGIKNIKKRIQKLHGQIHIDSKAGNTTIIIIIPIQHEN
jgi:signal transduction histidine kinase